MRREVERVAQFVGMPDASPALLEATVRVSSFASMAAPENRKHYDDHFIRKYIGPKMGLPEGAAHEVIKVRTGGGKVGGSRRGMISGEIRAQLDAKWASVIAGPTGCASYEEFKTSITRARAF